ncbi:unnamed protein product [Thlaspi arvense]|uniref:Uncharacterized protein n=1 Tax=Thlaspi arvense TaxID=13288 RepID=A0AAU9RTJ5_THLAR|nr:unnamed protein product [Thlaspi arvense]
MVRIEYDRFIPYRSAMDFGKITEGRKAEEEEEVSPSREAYNTRLLEALDLNRTRILAFSSKPSSLYQPIKHLAPRRRISQNPERVLDAWNIVEDFGLNLLDWGSANVLAIALGDTVCLWDASTGSVSELEAADEENGPVTSVNWAPDGRYLAVGLNDGEVQLWDSVAEVVLRTFQGCRHGRVGSLAWNDHILTTGGFDGRITNNDMRMGSNVVGTYKGHTQEVCGLKWSGQILASGGNDSLVHIWDQSRNTNWLHRLRGHTSAVKALAWCPFQSSLLATGGDQTIKFWNTKTGACLNSVDTGSQVCSLLWSSKERELLSSHGFPHNQLTLWKYPSMLKMAEFTAHTSRVLYMAQNPDGCTVASAAGDESLKFWNVFGEKPAPKKGHEPFSRYSQLVLKELLMRKMNWELIAEDNYRALADAIFDAQEIQAAERDRGKKKARESGHSFEEPTTGHGGDTAPDAGALIVPKDELFADIQ